MRSIATIVALLASIVLSACSANERPTCDWQTTNVLADADVVDGMSVEADLLLSGSVPVVHASSGATDDVGFTFERLAGDAVHFEGTFRLERVGSPLAISTGYLYVHADCRDRLEAPARIWLDTAVGEFAIDGLVVYRPEGDEHSFDASAPAASAALPAGAWSSDPGARARISWSRASETRLYFSVTWEEMGVTYSETLLSASSI